MDATSLIRQAYIQRTSITTNNLTHLELQNLLTQSLSFLLQGFDYEQETHSSLAIASRMLASSIVTLDSENIVEQAQNEIDETLPKIYKLMEASDITSNPKYQNLLEKLRENLNVVTFEPAPYNVPGNLIN